jgi:hypothetical protein
VPWESIAVTRKWTIFGQRAELQLGYPEITTLVVPSYVANKLANVAMDRWPESGPFDPVTWRDAARDYLRVWVIVTSFAGLFFSVSLASFCTSERRPVDRRSGLPLRFLVSSTA